METRPLPSSVNAEGPSKIRDATTHHKSALCCTLANHLGWVNASRPEKINQIKYLDQVLQANVVLNEGLARGYESEVSASFTRHCVWGISLMDPTVEQNPAGASARPTASGDALAPILTRHRLMA
jgi:hypothetical protein